MRAILAGLLLMLTSNAWGGTILVATNVDWNRGESLWIGEDGSDVQAYFAGVFYITLSGGGQTYDRSTLCVDLFTDITLGRQYNTELRRPDQMADPDLLRASWLVENALQPVQDRSAPSVFSPSQWIRTNSQAAGAQLALWDIVHDNGDGFHAGRVQAAGGKHPTDPAALSWAQFYEDASLGQSGDRAWIYWNTSSSGAPAQTLLGPRFSDAGPAPAAPEASTLILVGGALVAIARLGRRSRIH